MSTNRINAGHFKQILRAAATDIPLDPPIAKEELDAFYSLIVSTFGLATLGIAEFVLRRTGQKIAVSQLTSDPKETTNKGLFDLVEPSREELLKNIKAGTGIVSTDCSAILSAVETKLMALVDEHGSVTIEHLGRFEKISDHMWRLILSEKIGISRTPA